MHISITRQTSIAADNSAEVANDQHIMAMLNVLKRTIPLRATTVTMTFSTYQVNQAVQILEETLSRHEHALISPDFSAYTRRTWEDEAEGLARLH